MPIWFFKNSQMDRETYLFSQLKIRYPDRLYLSFRVASILITKYGSLISNQTAINACGGLLHLHKNF